MDSIEALAEAWASIDGKLDDFRAGKTAPNIEDFGGRYAGYMAEAEEMIARLAKRGFWLAPTEATAEMRGAGWPHFSALGDKPNGALDFADRRYRAMRDAHLATSPSPSTPSTSETERQRG